MKRQSPVKQVAFCTFAGMLSLFIAVRAVEVGEPILLFATLVNYSAYAGRAVYLILGFDRQK